MPHTRYISLLLCLGLSLACTRVLAQRSDSTREPFRFRNRFLNNIFQQAKNSVTRTPDASLAESYLIGKSEDPYVPYTGKIIRHINVETVNFDRNFKDTTARDKSWGARLGNRLHRSTRTFVIRNNLFIKENSELNPFKVADNERFIRTLEYIQDVRFVIDTIAGNPDSVDITVYTKDFFSIAGGAASDGFNHINANLYDANLAGMGQRLEFTGLYDYNRDPNWGYGAFYRKNNAGGSFIDVSGGYSTMIGNSFTREEQSMQYISLYRPLVSPYSRFAGTVTYSHNKAYNIYNSPDSVHYTYNYTFFDAWAGYNIGIKQLTATNNGIRDRRFLALRYYNRNFTEVDTLIGDRFNPVYNSSQAVLGTFTFFRQDYFKTQYVYGFGTTEDLPYGYNIAITGGYHKQLSLERPYAGVNATDYIATSRGDFVQLYFKGGGFLYRNGLQDASVLVGATLYSRIFFINSTKIRQYINTSYTHLYNRVTYAPLRINNYYGLRGFLSDSAQGGQRLSLQLETAFYLRYKLLGFQFCPFPWADLTLITPENAPYGKSSLYTALGAGLRARNENLVFETIEARGYFFPIAPQNMKGFKVIVNANIRFRYSSNYVTAPDLVQLNGL